MRPSRFVFAAGALIVDVAAAGGGTARSARAELRFGEEVGDLARRVLQAVGAVHGVG